MTWEEFLKFDNSQNCQTKTQVSNSVKPVESVKPELEIKEEINRPLLYFQIDENRFATRIEVIKTTLSVEEILQLQIQSYNKDNKIQGLKKQSEEEKKSTERWKEDCLNLDFTIKELKQKLQASYSLKFKEKALVYLEETIKKYKGYQYRQEFYDQEKLETRKKIEEIIKLLDDFSYRVDWKEKQENEEIEMLI